jgi:Type I phosphodiesterase / nucleotide pyrophosphatase
MLSNSLAAAVLSTAYIVVLVLQLNPSLSIAPRGVLPLVASVGPFYVFHLAIVFYVALVVRELLSSEPFSPGWISMGVLAWLGAAASAAGAVVMLGNLRTFALVLEPQTTTAMRRGAWTLLVASALFAAVGLVRAQLGDRRRRQIVRLWQAIVVVAIAAGSVAVPLALRGRGSPRVLDARPIEVAADFGTADRSARVIIVALDAASLDFITNATADGRLPNFGRILDAGSVMHLATLHPTSAEAVWAAVATGKLPQKNGVRSAGLYRLTGGDALELLPDYCLAHNLVRLGFLSEEPHTSATLRTQPLWSILSMFHVPVGVVGWSLTSPAPAVRGYLVSDSYHRLALGSPHPDRGAVVYPQDVQLDAADALERAAVGSPEVVPASTDSRFKTAGQTDLAYDLIATSLSAKRPTQVTIVRYQSLDIIGHYFLRYALPSEFGDVSDDERRRLGLVLERHYGFIDEAVGRAMATLGPDDLLLVVSGFGMQPLGIAKRLLEKAIGDPDVSGTHDGAPDGFLMAYGAPVARGRLAVHGWVVDVVPTVLYFLGLPIGRDMDGYARTDMFQRSFTDERPITFIPTYDR